MTHPSPKRNKVPKAALMRSGLVSLTTAKPVNTAQPRTTMNNARPMTNVFNKAHSTVRRPINNKIATKNSNFNKMVNTISGKNINTARPKAVVNAAWPKAVLNVVKGNQVNAIKASACWVWKPKTKVIDHVSKHNNASTILKRFDYIDAQGRSKHMTRNMSYLIDFEEIDRGYVAFGGNPKGGKITGRDTIKTGNLDFKNVYFVRELQFNLFSASQMYDKKNSVLFNDTECIVLSPNFKLTDESHVLLKVPRKNNMYSVDLKNIVPKGGMTEFKNKEMNQFCERKDSKLPTTFWAEVVNTACYVKIEWRQYLEKITFYYHCGLLIHYSLKVQRVLLEFKPSGDDEKKVTEEPGKEGADSSKEDESNDQEKNDNVNSTNNVNAASTNEVNVVGRKSSIELPNDSNMPKLEDIVYSYDDEDVGTEADMNNLDAFMPVSLIQTTRIHKDHPVEQIIGHLNSTPQTRRMTKNLEEHEEPKKVYRNKKDDRGIMIKKKARLVAQGYTQEEGIDYDEVIAPVARIEVIRLFLVYASFKDFVVYQMDVKSAFLYGKIEEEFYVCRPLGFEDPDFPNRVYKVEKALYELHQDPRAWYETLSTYLLDNGFQRGKIDKTLFIRRDKDEEVSNEFYGLGELTFFLGLQVKQKEDGIFISQDKYVTEILKKFGFTDVKTASTPMETQKPLLKDEDGEEVDVHLYRSMIGSLMYLTSSRPDIMFAVCACARYQVNPKVSHLHAVKRIFRYLKGQPKLGLWYPKDSPFDLVAYTDSDYAGASLDRKSTTGVNAAKHKLTAARINLLLLEKVNAFWSTVKEKKVNGEVQLQALVDGKKIVVTEASVRRDLQLEDADSVDCLPNATIFEQLTLIGTHKGQRLQPSMQLKELIDFCTKLQQRVLDLDNTKTAQAQEITSLKKRVKRLEKKEGSRTHSLKRLYKIGRSARVVSSEEASLGDQEDGRHNDDLMFDKGVLNDKEVFARQDMAEKEVSIADLVTTAGEVVTTANVEVSTASPTAATITNVELTLAQTLVELKSATPKTKGVVMQEPSESITTTIIPSKDKGKGIMVEEPLKMKKKNQVLFDEQEAIRLQAQFDKEERIAREKEEANTALIAQWNDIQDKVETDYELAQRLQAEEQEELTIEEKSKLFQQLLEKRRKHFAAKRAKEKRNRPPTKSQQRSIMCTYLKNMAGWKPKDLKTKSFANVQELFNKAMKRVNTFFDMDTELVGGSEIGKEGSETREESSSKRAGDELEQEPSKKQKMEDDKETTELQSMMEVIPDEEEVAGDAIPLATKPPSIVDWKIIKGGKIGYYQIIRADGNSKRYSLMIQMIKSFVREDLETL
ncbi:putative ribonuclease H-like domain-containing protein [Tanacetum coccineum]